MFRRNFTSIGVAAVVIAPLLMPESAEAQPLPGPPPRPPAMRPPGPRPMHAPPPRRTGPLTPPAPRSGAPGPRTRSGGPRPTTSWKPPVANRQGGRPGASLAGPGAGLNKYKLFTTPTDIADGAGHRSISDFAGGWRGLSSEASSGADALKDLYDREYARDVLNHWPWWSGGSWGYDSSGSSGEGYTTPYATEEVRSDDSTTADSQESNSSESTTPSSNENATNSAETTAVKKCMDRAVLAFQKGDYAAAQSHAEQAIRLVPDNVNMQEFLGLCQFAQGKYLPAAATLHAVLEAGPGWNWNTLSSLYTSVDIYANQLRVLEQHTRDNPSDASGSFVLAYHYLVLDERDAALHQLQHVAKLKPQDKPRRPSCDFTPCITCSPRCPITISRSRIGD